MPAVVTTRPGPAEVCIVVAALNVAVPVPGSAYTKSSDEKELLVPVPTTSTPTCESETEPRLLVFPRKETLPPVVSVPVPLIVTS